MISAINADQPIAASVVLDFRNRPMPGVRTILPEGTPPPATASQARNNTTHQREQNKPPAQPEAPATESASMFAAAVISGALPPVPQTMEQLIQRIGLSPIPEESQARLRDLLA